MISRLPRTPPEVHETALRIARMSRIVIQAFLPPELLAEAERRLYLTAVGEIQQLRDGPADPSLSALPQGDVP